MSGLGAEQAHVGSGSRPGEAWRGRRTVVSRVWSSEVPELPAGPPLPLDPEVAGRRSVHQLWTEASPGWGVGVLHAGRGTEGPGASQGRGPRPSVGAAHAQVQRGSSVLGLDGPPCSNAGTGLVSPNRDPVQEHPAPRRWAGLYSLDIRGARRRKQKQTVIKENPGSASHGARGGGESGRKLQPPCVVVAPVTR